MKVRYLVNLSIHEPIECYGVIKLVENGNLKEGYYHSGKDGWVKADYYDCWKRGWDNIEWMDADEEEAMKAIELLKKGMEEKENGKCDVARGA